MVELMVSLTLLGLIMVGLTPVFYAGLRTASNTNTRTEAAALAIREIEAMRAVPYTKVGFYADQSDYVSTYQGAPTVSLGATTPVSETPVFAPLTTETFASREFTVRRHITWVDAKENASITRAEAYKKTTVFVAWANDTGDHELRSTSIVYPGGRGQYTGAQNNGTPSTTSPAVISPPGSPTLNSATTPAVPAGYTTVNLAWTAPTTGGNVDHYLVQWANDSAFASGLQSSSNIPASNTTYPVTTLSASRTYYFRVYAFGIDGGQSFASNNLSATTATASGACTISGLNLSTTASPPSTTKTYLTASTGPQSGRNLMTVDLNFTLAATGSCGGGYRVYSKNSANVADPGSPWNLTGSGTNFAGQALTNGASGWAVGQHVFTVYDGATATTATHSLLVCAYVKVSSRSSNANQC